MIFEIGYKSNNDLYNKLENAAEDIYLLGDARNVRNVMYAIWDAYEIAI